MGKKGDTPISISPNPYTFFRIIGREKAEQDEKRRLHAVANMAFSDIRQTGTLVRRSDAPFFLNFSGEIKGQFSHVLVVSEDRTYPSYFPIIFPKTISEEVVRPLEQKNIYIKGELGSIQSGNKFGMPENNTYLSPASISGKLPVYQHSSNVMVFGNLAGKPKIITDARGESARFNVRVTDGASSVFLSCFATGDRARRLAKMDKGDRIEANGKLLSEITFAEPPETSRPGQKKKITTNKILVKEF